MAVTERDRPFSQFNYRVSWTAAPGDFGGGDDLAEDDVKAGFQEVSGLGLEITIAEYRAGNAQVNSPLKITGTHKVPDVTFKRGVIGRLDLWSWLKEVRDGSQAQLKNVTIKLMSEDRQDVAQEWRLINARPMKYTGPSLNGKGTDLAIEELVLAAEQLDMPE